MFNFNDTWNTDPTRRVLEKNQLFKINIMAYDYYFSCKKIRSKKFVHSPELGNMTIIITLVGKKNNLNYT
jgi:hypothetical protein